MKKTLFITLIVFIISLTVQSQITKGNWMVGGSGSYIHNTTDTEVGNVKRSVLTIMPNIGYFVKDKFVIGSTLSYNRSKNYYKDVQLNETNSYTKNYGIGLFSRYYFLKSDKIINVFTQVYFEKVFSEHNIGGVAKENGHNYGLKVGQVIFFNNSVGLEFSVDYEKRKSSDNYNADLIKVGLGFQIHLEKK